MRKTLFAAFLLGTTALYPTQAQAMPLVFSFIGALVTAIGAPVVGGAIAGIGGFSAAGFAAGYAVASSAFGGLLINAALSLGLSYLSSLLRPHPPTPNPGAKLVNVRQPISFMEFVYGRIRKGGPVNFWQANDGYRYYDVILAARKCQGPVAYFADERELTLDVDGFAQGPNYITGGHSRLQVVHYSGAPGQVAPPLLADNFPEWTSAHDMEGLCHVVAVAENTVPEAFAKVYPSGREPVITELLEGFLVYDPRDGAQDPDDSETWVYSDNAALIIADWITSSDGLGREVDWIQVEVEADICDLPVVDRNSNTLPKWRLGGSYTGSDDRETTRAQMGVACDCFFYEDVDGIVGFNVGRYIAPTITISDGDINRIQYSEGQDGTDTANAQTVQYTEPEQGYREAASAPYIVTDTTEAYSENSLQVFWIGNHNQAVRVSKRLLLATRAKYKISANLKYQGIRLIANRFFRLNHVEMGVDMSFEIDKLSRNEDGLTWTIEAHSVLSTDFDFVASVEEPEKPKRTSLTTASEVPKPTGITAISVPITGSVTIAVDWDDPPRDSLLNQVRYRVHSPAGPWIQISVPPGQSFQNILGLNDGQSYDIQVRAITAVGTTSTWVPNNAGNEDDPTLTVTTSAFPSLDFSFASNSQYWPLLIGV
jgi:hypothetical protein